MYGTQVTVRLISVAQGCWPGGWQVMYHAGVQGQDNHGELSGLLILRICVHVSAFIPQLCIVMALQFFLLISLLVSFPDHFSPHGKNWSGERPIPFSFPAVAKIVT